MNKKNRIKFLISFSITLFLAVLILFLTKSRAYQVLEFKALDLRFALKPAAVSKIPVLHIDIDDESLAELGRWPWPRIYHAKLTSILKEFGAKQVLMDVIFAEKYNDNPQQDSLFSKELSLALNVYLPFYFVEGKKIQNDKQIKSILERDITITLLDVAKEISLDPQEIKDDFIFVKKNILDDAARTSIKDNPEILLEQLLEDIEESRGWFMFSEDENYLGSQLEKYKAENFIIKNFSARLSGDKWPFKKECSSINPPILEYSQFIKGSGFLNSFSDIDGVTRRVPLFIKYQNIILPQLTVSALIDLLEVKEIEAVGSKIVFKQAKLNNGIKDIYVPVDQNACMLINWKGRWGKSFKHIPYGLILKLYDTREQLKTELDSSSANEATIQYLKKSESQLSKKISGLVKDKTCIIGLTATGTHDLNPIPIQEEYPMVGLHSNVFDTIVNENFIVKKDGFFRIFVFILTAFIISLSSLLKLSKSFFLTAGYAVLYFMFSLFAFLKFGFWVDLVGPFGIIVFGFSSITSYRFFTEEKEKLWIKKAFSHYLSSEVITELVDDPSRLQLGGERRQITVLFSDVRGFTSFSESHEPEVVVGMLNEILSAQVKVVFKYNGTLDKFVGDELMAFFGAPSKRHLNDNALVAVKTALEIQAKMKELSLKWTQEKKEVLSIGIGINSGDMVVGNMGSHERMDYTVIGDNVNLGARLCSFASKGEIIISESTYEKVKEFINAEKLEPITVKGKVKPILIYRVLSLK